MPLQFLIQSRRILFLHYILTSDRDSLLYKFFSAQNRNPTKGDWSETIKKDLSDFDIADSYENIASFSKVTFKARVKKACETKSLEYLLRIKSGQSKGKELSYSKLQLSEYLKNPLLNLNESMLLLKLRGRMLNFRANYKMKYSTAPGVVLSPSIICPLCQSHEDKQDMLTSCSALADVTIDSSYRYEDMFSQDQEKMVSSLRQFQKKWNKRELLVNQTI